MRIRVLWAGLNQFCRGYMSRAGLGIMVRQMQGKICKEGSLIAKYWFVQASIRWTKSDHTNDMMPGVRCVTVSLHRYSDGNPVYPTDVAQL
jgi:hypothetical protein